MAEADDLICPDCGNLREVCSDPSRDLFPQRRTCYVSAVRERSDRMWRGKHKDAKPDPGGYLPTDGVRIWASPYDLTPDDDFI